jgi:hypothetical protein
MSTEEGDLGWGGFQHKSRCRANYSGNGKRKLCDNNQGAHPGDVENKGKQLAGMRLLEE